MGQNWPVSMELMVLRDTPTISAKADCDRFFSALAAFSLFRNTMSSFRSPHPLKVVATSNAIHTTADPPQKTAVHR